MTDRFDFLVIGAGSAGCTVAARLAGEYAQRVLLVEAGESPRDARVARPADYLRLFGSSLDWDYGTDPQSELAGRRLRWPRGRGLGGSTLINAMIWVPPRAEDFAVWGRQGGGAWAAERLAGGLRRFAAPEWIEPPRWVSPTGQRFLEAARAALGSGEVAGRESIYLRMNRNGRRLSAADACLASPLRGQLEIQRCVLVRRILFSGLRARGVELASGQRITARRGVVICAGAVGAPRLLLQSGIGPADALQRVGIEPVADRREVGENLQDHLAMPVVFSTQARYHFPPRPSVRELGRWQALGTGPVASNLAEVGGWFDLGEGVSGQREAIQLHVTPTHYLRHPARDAPPAMTIAVTDTRPASRGRLWLEPGEAGALRLRIDPRYLDAPCDAERLLAGVAIARQIAAQAPLAEVLAGELVPGPRRQEDEAVRKAVARFAQTLYHPVGTCRLGGDEEAVVTPELRVRGVRGLWVADASVFPELPPANPNAMVMFVANHAAGLIAEGG